MKRGEQGSALVLALLFTTVFSILVASVITFADTGLKASKSNATKRSVSYAAEGAMDAAINRFRAHNPCDDYPAPVGPDGNPVGGEPLIVRCTNIGAERPANQPRQALLSLASVSSGEEGIVSTVAGQRIRGDVFSNSTVNSPPGQLVVEGGVSALGNCTNVITDTDPPDPPRCADSAPEVPDADPVLGRDPDYARGLDSVPVRRTAPPCPPLTQWLVELQPGYYDDAIALTALTSGTCPNGHAAGLVIWLQPGKFYFDLGRLGGPTVWTINHANVDVVGGTPKAALVGTDPRPALAAPGMCKVQGDEAPVDGVELVIGGETHFDVGGGAAVELCAEPSDDEQQIALYGLSPDRVHTLEPTITTSDDFDNPGNALVLGEAPEATADVSLTAAGEKGEITLSGYRPLVPPGSVIDSAVVRVRHQVDTGAPVTLTPDFEGVNCFPNADVALSQQPTMATDTGLDLVEDCDLDDAADLQALTLNYEVTAGSGPDQAKLDGIWIDVSYRAPVTRKPTVATSTLFNAPENATEIGEVPASVTTASLSDPTDLSGTVTLKGLDRPTLPDGVDIDAAFLRVAHHDEGMVEARGDTVTVTVDISGSPDLVFASNDTSCSLCLRPSGPGEDRIDLSGLTVEQMAGMTVQYKADIASGGGNTATPQLDGVWLDLVVAPTVTRNPATATSTGTTAFSNPDPNAKTIGEEPILTSTANLDAASPGTASATLTVSDFSDPEIPEGSVIESAVVRVAHRDNPAVSAVTVTATVNGSPCGATQALPLHPTAIEEDEVIDLTTCGLDLVSELAGINIQYSASVATGTGSDELDGIELDLSYKPPSTYRPDAFDPGYAGFTSTDVADALVIDSNAADAALTNPAAPPDASAATIKLTGYGTVPLPPGSVIDSAVLRVAHRETGNVDALSLTVTPGAGTPITVNSAAPCELCLNVDANPTAIVENGIDLKAKGFVSWDQLANLTVDYSATVTNPGAGSEHLDGIELDIHFRTPELEPLSGCLATVLYAPASPGPGSGCALVRTDGSDSTTRFVVQGTVYAPTAPLDISMNDVQGQVLTRGLIARTIRLGIDDSTFDRPIAGVPPEAVRFTAYPRNHRFASTAAPSDFANPDNAKVIGESPPLTADVDVDDSGASTGRITLGDFALPALREGSDVHSVVLVISHRESPGIGSIHVKVTLTGGNVIERDSSPVSGSCELCLNTSTDPAALRTERIELTGISAAELATVSIEYSATAAASTTGTAYLDGIEMEVFANPLLRARASFDPQGRVVVEGWSVLR